MENILILLLFLNVFTKYCTFTTMYCQFTNCNS